MDLGGSSSRAPGAADWKKVGPSQYDPAIIGQIDMLALEQVAKFSPPLGSVLQDIVRVLGTQVEKTSRLEREVQQRDALIRSFERDIDNLKDLAKDVQRQEVLIKELQDNVADIKAEVLNIKTVISAIDVEMQTSMQAKLQATFATVDSLEKRVKFMDGDTLKYTVDDIKKRMGDVSEAVKQITRLMAQTKKHDKEIVGVMKQIENFNLGFANLSAKAAERSYCDKRFDEILAQMGKMYQYAKKEDLDKLKLQMMAAEFSPLAIGDVGTGTAAAGRRHYRCLTCDRVTPTLAGAQTEAFRMETSTGDTVVATRGREVGLFGEDGHVYKGTEDVMVLRATASSPSPPDSPNASRRTKVARPKSAHQSRATLVADGVEGTQAATVYAQQTAIASQNGTGSTGKLQRPKSAYAKMSRVT